MTPWTRVHPTLRPCVGMRLRFDKGLQLVIVAVRGDYYVDAVWDDGVPSTFHEWNGRGGWLSEKAEYSMPLCPKEAL